MSADAILTVLCVFVIACSVTLGPLRLLARAGLRWLIGPHGARSWQAAALLGVQLGLVAGVLVAGSVFGAQGAFWAAVLGLLVLLGGLDIAWRWLPHIWTGALFVLGVGFAALNADLGQALGGALVGAGLLLGLQMTFRILRGIDALGTGDILLIGAIGTISGPMGAIFVLGLGAATALIVESLQRLRPKSGVRRRMGVAYGAHLCGAFLLFLLF